MISKPQTGTSSQQVLLILRRRWRLLFGVWILVVAGTSLWTFMSKRLYRPQVTLEIRPEQSVLVTQDDPSARGASNSMWETYYKTQENILTSPALIEQCLKALPEPIRKSLEAKEDPINSLTKMVDIELVRASFVMKVGVIHTDPEVASQMANTLVSIYLQDTNRRMRDVKTEAVESLSQDTLPGMRKRTADAEKDLATYREASGFIDVEEQYNMLIDTWKKASLALEDVKLRRINLASQLDTLARYRNDGTGAELNPTLQLTRVLDRLSQKHDDLLVALAAEELRHKDAHPSIVALKAQLEEVQGKMKAAIEGALLALETDVLAATAEEQSIAEEMRAIETQLAKAGVQRTEYRRLDEEVVAAKEVYASYLKRHGEESATAGSGVSSVRVIDFARPPKEPWLPNIPLNLAVGCLAGLMLGCGTVLGADHIDNRVHSAEEVEVFVGLEVLTTIPQLGEGRSDGPTLLGDSASVAEFEAFRGLRAAILTRFEKIPGGKALAVLSPLPGDGKTTVALNLAKVMSMEGKRVLLIDADMRRPKLSKFIDGPDGPEIDAVLEGRATLEEAALPSKIAGVNIVGMRHGSERASEMAGSSAFEDMLKAARQGWDFVIVDNAPVLQASESPLVARRADAAILVIREGKTGRNLAHAAAKRLKSMGVGLLGAVLNCAARQTAGYAYGYGYGYGVGKQGSQQARS
jgi:polysaccharide biosynthesis transport protein